jgi:hypothetical protein
MALEEKEEEERLKREEEAKLKKEQEEKQKEKEDDKAKAIAAVRFPLPQDPHSNMLCAMACE